MLLVSLIVTNGYDANGEPKDVKFYNAGAGIFQENGRGGVYG